MIAFAHLCHLMIEKNPKLAGGSVALYGWKHKAKKVEVHAHSKLLHLKSMLLLISLASCPQGNKLTRENCRINYGAIYGSV
jgi:hypothetical protein